MFESLCRPGGCEKDDQESTISRDLGILFGSLCRPGRCEKDGQELTISHDLGIVFETLCRPGRCEKVVKRKFRNRRFLAIWASCLGASVDLDVVKRMVKN